MSNFKEAINIDGLLLDLTKQAHALAVLLPAAHEMQFDKAPPVAAEPEVSVSSSEQLPDPTGDAVCCPERGEIREVLILTEGVMKDTVIRVGMAREALDSAMKRWDRTA